MPDTTQMWDKTKTNSKAGFDKVYGWVDKLGKPVNKLSNKLGSEAFWPTTLDKECEKAARIVRSFCKDGFYVDDPNRAVADDGGPKSKQRTLKKIPPEVIQNAKGLCIFTTMRTGFWAAASGGAGIIVARMPNGEWSPPSGIMMHTAGIGFLIGVDIYDCVIVINTDKALEAFQKLRCTLGGELSGTAGPLGVGGIMDTEVHKRQSPIFTYIKGRGFYAGVQIDGTIILERWDENERFYNQKVGVQDILRGKVRHAPYETRILTDTLKAAEGQMVDEALLPAGPTPGDFLLEDDGHVFGVPDLGDPDPYGVLALQAEGMEIREAGTRDKPNHEEFNFQPSPSSPLQGVMKRRSVDSKDVSAVGSRRSSWRTSAVSTTSKMTDTATQTDEEENGQLSPYAATFGDRLSRDGNSLASPSRPKSISPIPPPLPPRQSVSSPLHTSARIQDEEEETSPTLTSGKLQDQDEESSILPHRRPHSQNAEPPFHPSDKYQDQDEEDDADNEDADDAVVITDVQTASFPHAAPVSAVQISKPRLVTVQKVAPPKLPPRSAARSRSKTGDTDSIEAPTSPTSSSGLERKAGESSEADARPESLSSFDTRVSPEEDAKLNGDAATDTWAAETPRAEKPADDGFQEVELKNPTPTQELTREEKKANRASSEAIRNFAAQMRMDGDDDDDDEIRDSRKAPGAW